MISMPATRRRGDADRSFTERARDLALWFYRSQSQFSLFSAALPATLAVTLLVDLIVGHAHIQRGMVAVWIVSYALMTVLPLMFGRAYPRWAGLLLVTFLTFWSAYSLLNSNHAHMELNALLETPMVAVYLGWFYWHWVARLGIALHLAVLTIVVFNRTPVDNHSFSSELALTYAVLIAAFCLEVAAHVHRVAEREAQYDQLTGALNRRGLIRRSAKILRRAERTAEPVVVVVVDFDDFSAVNDHGGHAEGDRALRCAVDAWVRGLDKRDLVSRTGGDEFVLVIHADEDAANERLTVLRENAEYPWSWGLARVHAGDSLFGLMQRADRELYERKGVDRR